MSRHYQPGRRKFLQQTAALVGATPLIAEASLGRGDQAAGGLPAKAPGPQGPSIRMASALSPSGTVWILRAPDAGFQEQWAARELARGLKNLGLAREPVQAALGAGQPAAGDAAFTLAVDRGTLRHPEVSEIAREHAEGRPLRVRITGATPQALLYGVFAFLERQGALFGLDGEVYPPDPAGQLALPAAGLPWIDQPRFAVRGLVPWPDFLNCITVFNREDHRAYLEAMVRMRFNTVGIHVYSGLNQWVEPFLSFEYGGVGHLAFTDTTATNRWGYLPQRTSRFGMGAPDFYDGEVFGSEVTTLARSPWECAERAQALWADAFQYARKLGLRTGLGFEPCMIPDEIFRATPPEARSSRADAQVPAARIDPDTVTARDILEARLGQLLDAYPDVDDVWLWEDEGMSWASQRAKVPLPVTPFLQAHSFLARHAPGKRLVVSGWGGVTRHFQDFHQRLPEDIVFSSLSDTFGWEPVSEEYGQLGVRERWPVLWIEDDPAMWLPQLHVHRFAEDIGRAESFGCQGLLGIHWRHRILDATAGFQSRASWRRDLGPSEFYRDLARANARAPRVESLARVLDDADRERRLLCTFTGEITDGRHQTQEYAGDYAEAFAFWNGYEPEAGIKASQREVALTLRSLADSAGSPAERERIAYLAGHVEFLVPYAESWSLASRLHQVLQDALAYRKKGDGDAARGLVADEGMRLWVELAPLVRQAILAFQSIVSTRSDLGTLASMHNKYARLALERLRLSMKEFLGTLPPEAEAAGFNLPDAGAALRVFLPTRPTLLARGERVMLTAVAPGGQPPRRVLLRTRPAGTRAWALTEMQNRGRRTYEAELVWIEGPGTLLEYYVEVEGAGPRHTVLCTAPLEAPDRVYSATLIP